MGKRKSCENSANNFAKKKSRCVSRAGHKSKEGERGRERQGGKGKEGEVQRLLRHDDSTARADSACCGTAPLQVEPQALPLAGERPAASTARERAFDLFSIVVEKLQAMTLLSRWRGGCLRQPKHLSCLSVEALPRHLQYLRHRRQQCCRQGPSTEPPAEGPSLTAERANSAA